MIEDISHLQSERVEIDENLCRAELTASQRTGFTKRRKQIWEALHPEEKLGGSTCATQIATEHKDRPQNQQGFAAATAEATGQSKATTNRAIARADALGDEALNPTLGCTFPRIQPDTLVFLRLPFRDGRHRIDYVGRVGLKI